MELYCAFWLSLTLKIRHRQPSRARVSPLHHEEPSERLLSTYHLSTFEIRPNNSLQIVSFSSILLRPFYLALIRSFLFLSQWFYISLLSLQRLDTQPHWAFHFIYCTPDAGKTSLFVVFSVVWLSVCQREAFLCLQGSVFLEIAFLYYCIITSLVGRAAMFGPAI